MWFTIQAEKGNEIFDLFERNYTEFKKIYKLQHLTHNTTSINDWVNSFEKPDSNILSNSKENRMKRKLSVKINIVPEYRKIYEIIRIIEKGMDA